MIAEGDLQEVRDLKVAVDGLRDAYYLGAQLPQIFRQKCSIGIRIIPANYN